MQPVQDSDSNSNSDSNDSEEEDIDPNFEVNTIVTLPRRVPTMKVQCL